MKNATFRQLRVFVTAAKHQSFVRAARDLALSPPAITQQIKELEGHVGLTLFDRSARKVTLTAAGEYMLVYARRILSTAKDAEDAARRLIHADAGVLAVGMVSGAKYFMMDMLATFLADHPQVDLQFKIGNRERLLAMLADNEVDLAVMGRVPAELNTRGEIFAPHPLGFVASPDHVLAQVGKLRAEDLRYHRFVARETGSGTRAAMENFFTEARVDLRIQFEVPSNETLKQVVMAGLAPGFVSLHAVAMEVAAGRLKILDIADTPIIRAWHVVHTAAKLLSPPAEALRYFILERGEEYLSHQFGDQRNRNRAVTGR